LSIRTYEWNAEINECVSTLVLLSIEQETTQRMNFGEKIGVFGETNSVIEISNFKKYFKIQLMYTMIFLYHNMTMYVCK